MTNILDKKNDTFGRLAAVKTVTNAYPVLNKLSAYGTVDGGVNVSIDFLLSLLNLVGVTKADIIDFICKLLCGEKFYADPNNKAAKVGDGILDVIEQIIKAALLVNCKNMFSGCQVDPIIPDYLMEYINPHQGCSLYGGKGIDFNIANLDAFGVLSNCPVDDDGSIFYFDSKPTIYKDSSGNTSCYNVSTVWKSMDFNAFLWYVINKGNNNVGEHYKNVWDNRYQNVEKFKNDTALRDKFFAASGYTQCHNMEKVSSNNITIEKIPYLICDYNEFAGNNESNVLRVALPAERYHQTGLDWIGDVKLNKTIFEFNYDYIYSLKLFDSKTLIANIINSLVNLTGTVNLNIGMNAKLELIREKVSRMVDDVMLEEADDDYADKGCVKTFSNMTYDELLKDAEKKQAGEIYNKGGYTLDYDTLKSKIKAIDTSDNQVDAVKVVVNELTDNIVGVNVDYSLNVSAQYDVITNFLKQTMIEIVMQLVSPKVMLLFAVNQVVMGDVLTDIKDMENGVYVFSPEKILDGMFNMIHNIIKQILSMLIQQLQQFLFEKLKPLLKLFTSQLLLETVKDYKDLITRILTNCMMDPMLFGTAYGNLNTDGVNYADIVPYQQVPKNNDC